jgi:hypothetical protein
MIALYILLANGWGCSPADGFLVQELQGDRHPRELAVAEGPDGAGHRRLVRHPQRAGDGQRGFVLAEVLGRDQAPGARAGCTHSRGGSG